VVHVYKLTADTMTNIDIAKAVLLSATPVAGDYLERLRADLKGAELVRFSVCYVSTAGLKLIGLESFEGAFKNKNSFGVADLNCSTGFEPLVSLRDYLAERNKNELCLKYFMDPQVEKDPGEPKEMLLHEKLVYIQRSGNQPAVIYLGSHNWTQRALGGDRTARNAEVSWRLEVPFEAKDLQGNDDSLGAQVNSHLIACRDYKSCHDVKGKERFFKKWYEANCRRREHPPKLEEYVALLAVANPEADLDPEKLKNHSLYFRVLDEREGSALWDWGGNTRVFILLWGTLDDLKASRPPTLLVGTPTTVSAGEASSYSGTDTSTVGEFDVFMLDQKQKVAHQGNQEPLPRPQVIKNKRGVEVEYFDWCRCRPNELKTFEEVNDGSSPTYWFYMKIEEVVYPDGSSCVGFKNAVLQYRPEQFAAHKKPSATTVKLKGYKVDQRRADEIKTELKETFGVDVSQATVLPRTEEPQNLGFREGGHPMYEAYLPVDVEKLPDNEKTPGDLVPDPEWSDKPRERVERVMQFFSNPWERLCEMWGRNEES